MMELEWSELEDKKITGVMIQYYIACKRELWYFFRKIDFNMQDENIRIGKIIHETSYSRESKEVALDFVKFDIIEYKDKIVISEVKKSTKLLEPAKYQLLYYMLILEKITGKQIEGRLRIPKVRKIQKQELTKETREKFRKIINEIDEIVKKEIPPHPQKKPYCKNCAYLHFCWI